MADNLRAATDEELAERGLKRVVQHVCLFWDKHNGWVVVIEDDKELANDYKGFGDFAGSSEVVCIVPIEAG